ncbi:MAG: hypothetical protein CBB68_15355 [Rhodospirillaceae bacterium TMED8]|nr:hypothetical protein [Magnetovibrio sp.]OUT47800.1 MAG: hypothetical protein CBB68_15355 [Rhodospirillaceae bacterium TMED8]
MEISPVLRLEFVQTGSMALRQRVSPIPVIPEISAAKEGIFRPQGVTPSRYQQVRSGLNLNDAREALREAVSAGISITSGLHFLRDGIRLAASSLTSPDVNLLNRGWTRVSVINIQVQIDSILSDIDRLVQKTAVSGVNLISSLNGAVRLQTTAFGGGLEVMAQPLDSVGLGLLGINLKANGGINKALTAVTRAISRAETRLATLESLQRVVDGSLDFNKQFMVRIFSNLGSHNLMRGALVNLIG